MTEIYAPAPLTLKIARTILADAIPDAAVVTKIPFPQRPAKFVRVQRAGGHRPALAFTDMGGDVVKAFPIVGEVARILVELWAMTVEDVEQMTVDAIAALQNAQGTTVDGAYIQLFGNIDGPVDFPDPEISSLERWQFQGDLTLSTTSADGS